MEGFLLGYDSNSHAYRVFNKIFRCVEISCDVVFDETNGSQGEQVGLDELDDEEAPSAALRNMLIGDVRPQESSNDQGQQSSNKASPSTQDDDRQEDGNDQGGGVEQNEEEKDDEQEESRNQVPHPRVHQSVQRDHPVDNILGDIAKGVTTRSRVATFCEHYSLFLFLNLLRWKMLYVTP
jgi:hypothetical protein